MSKNRAPKRIAPKALKGEPHKAKVSVAIDSEALQWVTEQAAAANVSVSAVVNEAIQDMRRARAMHALLAELGVDDISADELKAALTDRMTER